MYVVSVGQAQIQKLNVLSLIEGDGFAEVGKWCGFGLKSLDTVRGLWRSCLSCHFISGKWTVLQLAAEIKLEGFLVMDIPDD